MILVTVGTQKFQFDRLLKKIDELIEKGVLKDEVFAQIGYSNYKPVNYDYDKFITQDELNNKIENANLVITHAGTGIVVNASKKGKKIICVPRLSKHGEHVDNHQVDLINEFDNDGLVEACYDVEELEKALKNVKKKKYEKYVSNCKTIIENIRTFIEK